MISPDDILPPAAYGPRRAELRRALRREKARRRIELGPKLSLLFESRLTVLAHIHEILWIEGRRSAADIEREIDEYACLVPGPRRLTATLTIHAGSAAFGEELSHALMHDPGTLTLSCGQLRHGCHPLRRDDAIPAAVHYLGFEVLPWTARRLVDDAPMSLDLNFPLAPCSAIMPRALRVALAQTLVDGGVREQAPAENVV